MCPSYYTVAHILQGGDLTGTTVPHPIKPEQLTDAVFDYVFLKDRPFPTDCGIDAAVLHTMQREFRYWYPLDLRVSGKDLIPNHLTMSLYNHTAVWDTEPALWPRGFFTNGHVMVDGEKMSKSLGNFLTVPQCVARWGADATRMACADAGDSLEDANFVLDTANAAILKLTKEQDWMMLKLQAASEGKLRTGPYVCCFEVLVMGFFYVVDVVVSSLVSLLLLGLCLMCFGFCPFSWVVVAVSVFIFCFVLPICTPLLNKYCSPLFFIFFASSAIRATCYNFIL